jgi:hypothetical protein
MKDFCESLRIFNCTDRQIEICGYLLKAGRVEQGYIFSKFDSPRTSLKRDIDFLIDIGLVKFSKIERFKYFELVDADELQALKIKKEREVLTKFEAFDDFVKMVDFTKGNEKTQIKILNDVHDLAEVRKEIEMMPDEIWQITSMKNFRELGLKIEDEHLKRLDDGNRIIRAMIISDEKIEITRSENIEVVSIPTSVIPLVGEVTVCGDVVIMFNFENGLEAIKIRSKVLASLIRNVLEFAWQRAKQITIY